MADIMNNFEILAPAGSMETLTAAVRSGADAVYIGTTRFGARASAKNFDYNQLKEAVEFCHKRGVKVYLTMNTLITDKELPQALETAQQAYKLPIDAIIVQDVGFADLLHKAMPDLHLHGSTQMSVHTPEGAKLLYALGFTRVVLSREMTKNEIAEVAKSCPIELEVFVHGALCMCVSGQCYFSSVLGGRSGNRGQCAQTCRLPFLVEGGTGNDLSLKDMSILENLRELQKIGVTSAKIEGRLKRPEYVASAVNVARQFYDTGTADEESCIQLKSVFSRSGFTNGYYTNNRGADMFGTRQKDDVMSATTKVLNQIHSIYKNEYQRIPVEMELTLRQNKPATLTATVLNENPIETIPDNDGVTAVFKSSEPSPITVTVTGDLSEKAINKSLTTEKANAQLCKTGGTPFKAVAIKSDIDKNTTVSMSSLNNIRRNALDMLTQKLVASYTASPIRNVTLLPEGTRREKQNVPLRAVFSDWEIPHQFSQCELVFIPENTPDEVIRQLIEKDFNLGIEISPGMFGREKQVLKNLEKAKANGINHILVNNLGAVPLCREFKMNIHGNFRLNVMNTQSIEFFKNLGLADVTASFELTLQQINSLGGKLPIGTLIYGKLPLMLTRNCPGVNSKTKTCAECGGLGYINDRKNILFPYKCSGGCTQIFNSVPLYMGDRLREIHSSDFNIMLFTTENTEEKLYAFNSILNGTKIEGGHTRGLYYKGIL